MTTKINNIRACEEPPPRKPTHTWKTPLHSRGDKSFTRDIPVIVLRRADTPGFYVVSGDGRTFVVAKNELKEVRCDRGQ